MDISGLDISYLDFNGLDISYLDKRSLDISGLDTGSGLERSCMVRVRVVISDLDGFLTWHKNLLGFICWVLFCAGWPLWEGLPGMRWNKPRGVWACPYGGLPMV